MVVECIQLVFEILLGQHALSDQFLCIDIARILVFGDDVIQFRLCETGFVTFVMPILSVRKQIDENIDIESLAKLQCQFCNIHHRFGVVAVDVENRRVGDFCNVGALGARTCVQIIGGEPNLVVDHDVDGAAGLVTFQFGKLYGFINHALTGNGGIAVNKDR